MKLYNYFLVLSVLVFHPVPTASITWDSLQLSSERYSECGRYACAETGKYQFRSELMYSYNYTLSINSTFDRRKERSELKLEFRVDIRIKSCEGVLRVKRMKEKEGFSMFDKEEVDKIYEELNQNLLRFSFYDGSIYNVCPGNDESILSLNIKKGILSAFQNKMKRFDIDRIISEKDVNGFCPTHYNLERVNGTSLVIRKVKDIPNCVERYQLHSIIPTSRYVFQSRYNKWAPLNSSVTCHQTIDHSVPIQILCTEDHTMRLTNMTYNSRTTITQKFDLIEEIPIYVDYFNLLYFPDDFTSREELSFNHRKPKKSEISELEESEELLLQLCNIAAEEFQPEAASAFTKFIHTARHLSYDALEALLEKAQDICSSGRKHVQDSLPFLRSTSAISLMKEIIINGNISESTANGWLFAMSLFSRPDEDVINSVTPLLLQANATDNMLLSISSVVHSFCSWAADCNSQEIILSTINSLERRLNETLLNSNDPNKIIVLLKSLGNTGVLTDTIGYTLANVIWNPEHAVEVRIAAIESHRRLPCDFNLKFLLNIFTNVDIEAEVRITAYLQVIRCPDYGSIKIIKTTLENENVNQVGTFVWSHFQNMAKSALPYRTEIQSILQDYYLQKKFRTDFRKFSRNYETSFYISDYGIGGVIIGNVIFSTESYIPKYLSLNVTVNVYGESINVLEVNVFLEGFEKLAEQFFKSSAEFLAKHVEKKISLLRILRSIPTSLKDKIKSLPNTIIGNFPEPFITFSFKLFGNEIKYVSCRGTDDITNMIDNFDIQKIIREFLNGKEIKYDYSTVFMDISYVSPTGAGVPLNLDAVGIAITNFDVSVYVEMRNSTDNFELLIDGKFKPRFSVNFEGTMGTDLVYEQTQVQLKSKMYTVSEVEGNFHMDGYDNIMLSLNLPLKRLEIFSLESDLYFKDNSIRKDVMLTEAAMSSSQPVCFWPLIDQLLGLKVCSTYNIPDSTQMLQSLLNMVKGPFKFSLYVEKSDQTAKKYIFKYNRNRIQENESSIIIEFETPGSEIKRDMKTLINIGQTESNITLIIHSNLTTLQSRGLYKNTPTDKVLNFDLDINGQKHIEVIIELHMRQEKRALIYTPKLYFAITSKPVAELSGTYKWVEKKGVSQCDIDLQFKTNKFDSNITGYIVLNEGSASTNVHVLYKFEKGNPEKLNFEFKYKDKSNKMATALASNFQLESSFYPEINFALNLKYQKSHDRIDVKVDYISNPFLEDDRKKLNVQYLFSYFRTFNGMKLNTYLEFKKPITDVNVKFSLSHQSNPSGSSSQALVRYAKDKDIVVKLDIFSPQTVRFHYELKLNATLPNVHQPMIVHVRLFEKYEKEYDVDFSGTWFSGHTAMAKGIFQDKSSHYLNSYNIKLLVRSRLFNEILLNIRLTFYDFEHKLSVTVDHNNLKYAVLARHLTSNDDLYETYVEYIYNNTATYYLNNRLDIGKKELLTELHLDRIRDIHIAAKGTLRKWNSNVGVEFKWDVNRDPSQKIMVNFNTRSIKLLEENQYIAKFIFEYPGHISVASLLLNHKDNYYSLAAALEMNPLSVIQIMGYCQNELLTKGIAQIGFKLLTPFENWRESAFSLGFYSGQQNFQTNGSLIWQGNQNIIFDTKGGYKLDDNVTSVTLFSILNSTLEDLSALAFGVNYTSITNQAHLSFLLQPNLKYSLYVSTTGNVQYYKGATEYSLHVATRTPFLEYVETEFNSRLKFMTESRINSDMSLRLNKNFYTLYLKGILNPFEKTKLCLHATTPFEKFQDINGILFYDPDEKHVSVNLTSAHFQVRTDVIYVYNNISNFHLKLEVITPMSYLSNLILVGMYNGKALDLKCGWNTFILGFAGVTHFNSWSDLEYEIQLFTPIESFRRNSAIFKSLMKGHQINFKARVLLSNITKAGLNFEYNTDMSKVTYLDECDNYYDKDTPGIYKSIILTNAIFELDTLMYPTIMGFYVLRKTDNRYTFDSKIAIFFLKAALWNELEYESNMSFNDSMHLTSSIDMFSEILTDLRVKQIKETRIDTSADVEITSFNEKLKGGVDIYYEHHPDPKERKSKVNGIHNLNIKLHTPFDLVERGKIIMVTEIQNTYYQTSINMFSDYTNISLSGDMQLRDKYFNLKSSFNMSSMYITIPVVKLQILRDFSRLEKQIIFSLQEPSPNNDYFQDIFLMKSMWYIDSRNYITLSGELKSPFRILDELKVSLFYSHELEAETYQLEAYMKYSNKTEMKARANLRPPNVTLNLESSMEGLRQAHFVGNLERTGPGQQKIDAVMITNSNFKVQGWSSVTDLTPFSIRGKLLRGKEGIELSSVEMSVKKKAGGYNVLAALYSKGKTLNVDTEISDLPNNTRIINLQIITTKGDLERLQVNAELKVQHPGIYVLNIKGDSAVNNAKGSSTSAMEIWFRNGIGAIFASLESSVFSGKADFFSAWKPPYHAFASGKVQYSIQKEVYDLLDSKIYFMRSSENLENMTTGISINLNKKWRMETNLTMLVKSINDSKVISHVVLPNKNAYSVAIGLKYNKQLDIIQHLLVFSRPEDSPCYTLSDINLVSEDVRGFFAFKCGLKDTLFMVDNFTGKKTRNKLILHNLIRSNTLANSLITNVHYEKPYQNHIANVKFYYPSTNLIASADINFQSTKNFECYVNTTTPFQKIPYFACALKAKTEPNFYQRFGQVHLHDKPALFNITHVKSSRTNGILNEGQVSVVFPVATWHEGVLTYVFEDKFVYLNGSAELFYNNERFLTGNFTRHINKLPTQENDLVHLEIGNSLMPVGINYLHETSDPHVIGKTFDFKRTEIYKLQNASVFNVTTEALVENLKTEEWTTLRLLNFHRSIILKSYEDGKNLHESEVNLKLKPELWFNYILLSNKRVTASTYEKLYNLNIAYPRRNFSLISDFSYGNNYLTSQLAVHNLLVSPKKCIGLIFNTQKLIYNHRQTAIMLFHPSFEKNVTLFSNFTYTKTIPADVYVEFEYSSDENRKLVLTGIMEDKSIKGNRNYTLRLTGNHPATKFHLDVSGALQSETGIHFIGNNISYRRSYLPDHYWRGRAIINTKQNMVEAERISLRGKILFHGDYGIIETKHVLNTIIVEGTDTDISGHFEVDIQNKECNSIVNLTSDASDKLQIEGNMPENRVGKFNIWRTYNDFTFPQLSFYLALNNSRFLSSALLWRTDIGSNILRGIRSSISYLWVSAQESIEFWTQFLRSEATDTVTDVWNDAKPVLQEFLDDFGDMKTIQDNINYFKSVLNDTYNANEFYLRDIHNYYNMLSQEISLIDKIGSLPKLVSEIWESMGETGQVIRKSLIWMVNTVRELYEDLMNILDELVEGKAEVYVSKFIKKATQKFDNFVKDLHISFISSTESVMNELMSVLSHYWKKILLVFEPTFIEIIHHIDSTFWASTRKLVDFVYARKDELMNSPYFLRSANFTQKLDSIYKDFSKNDFVTNFKKYFGIVLNAIYEYYFSQIPFREELTSISNEIWGEIEELYKLPLIAYTVDNVKSMYNQVVWLYQYFDVTTSIQRIIPFIFRQYTENSFTALETEMKNHKPKTKFIFDPENGVIKLEQKLPFPWHAFNETPIYEEIAEYKSLKRIQSLLTKNKIKFWSVYHTMVSLVDPNSWFPPFKSYAILVGLNNYVTFDGRHVPFYGNTCQYLLSRDFINDEYSLVLNSNEKHSSTFESISLLTDEETVIISFSPPNVTLESQNAVRFPLQLNNTFVYYDNNILTVKNQNGVTLECNMHYSICIVQLSGWFHGKVSGLLGTMNNEPSDDVTIYNKHVKAQNPQWYLWTISSEHATCPAYNQTMMQVDNGVNEKCSKLFLNTNATFEPCFSEVDPMPYYDICTLHLEDEKVCSVAMAYVKSCMMSSIPVRIPAYCVKCDVGSSNTIEGTFKHLEGKSVPQSGDVVFIVEAKSCNEDLLNKKNIQLLIQSLSKEFISNGFTRNRFTLVVFGGDGVQNSPHNVIVNNRAFSNVTIFPKYFENLTIGNGNSDIFSAIRFASKLPFRIGVSKTFILIPCTNCDPMNMALDYSVLHHAMTEKTVTLHILMNENFPTDKTGSGKVLFGLDSYTAYIKSDVKNPKGDYDYRRQVKLTKSLLGYCTPLALESNGTLFTAKFLSDNTNLMKKFVSSFTKRVALSIKPNECQECECHSDNNGIPYYECISCAFPTPVNFDFGIEDESDLQGVLDSDA